MSKKCQTCGGVGVIWLDDEHTETAWCFDCIDQYICPKCGGEIVYYTYDDDLNHVPFPGTRDDIGEDDEDELDEVCESCGFIWDEVAQSADPSDKWLRAGSATE